MFPSRSCYAADTLASTRLSPSEECDALCPGDKGLFCGGRADDGVFLNRRWPGPRRTMARDASSNVLLTLYVLDIGGEAQPGPDSSSINVFPTSTIGKATSSATNELAAPSGGDSSPVYTRSEILSPVLTRPGFVSTEKDDLRPELPFQTTVTTVKYTIVDPNNPLYLTVTEYCATLEYQPCECRAHQTIPIVQFTTYKALCNACGYSGEN